MRRPRLFGRAFLDSSSVANADDVDDVDDIDSRPGPDGRAVRRIGGMSAMPRGHIRALVENADGQRRPRSAPASRSDHSRLFQAGSVADLHQGRRCLRVREQMEAALLQESRQRLFPAARAVGHHAQGVARVLRRERHRLVDAVLSARQHAASHRTALRRVPFGELQHDSQNGHRVERRLREVPRARQQSRRAAIDCQHREPCAARLREGQRHVHPVPLTGPAHEGAG